MINSVLKVYKIKSIMFFFLIYIVKYENMNTSKTNHFSSCFNFFTAAFWIILLDNPVFL